MNINLTNAFENNAMPNKSMDVRRKQLLSYQRHLLPLGLRVAGFRPRHLNRWVALGDFGRVKI